MTKLTENLASKVTTSKGGWPLLIGVWALVETVASGWGVGAAFLVNYWQISSANKDKLAILRNPETAKKLSAYQAHMLLYGSSLIYFLPFIVLIILVSMIKILIPNQMLDLSSPSLLQNAITKLCAYSKYDHCPTSISLPYVIVSVLSAISLMLVAIINTKKTIAINVKSYLFKFTYNKWLMAVYTVVALPIFMAIICYFYPEFFQLTIQLLTPKNVDFNLYLQGSILLVFLPFFFYTTFIYLISTFIFIRLASKARSNSYFDRVELFNRTLDAKDSSEIKKIWGVI